MLKREDSTDPETIELQMYEYFVTWGVPERLIQSMSWHALRDRSLQLMLLTLDRKVMGHESESITYPADWWQAFKDRWLPAPLKKRFPVRMNSTVARELFPELGVNHSLGKPTYVIETRTGDPDAEA